MELVDKVTCPGLERRITLKKGNPIRKFVVMEAHVVMCRSGMPAVISVDDLMGC